MYPDLVVVDVQPALQINEDLGLTAARYEQLGLVAYGKDRAEAVSELKRVFNYIIRFHRERGQLPAYLERMGVNWTPASEYSGRYENTNTGQIETGSQQVYRQTPLDRNWVPGDFRIAA